MDSQFYQHFTAVGKPITKLSCPNGYHDWVPEDPYCYRLEAARSEKSVRAANNGCQAMSGGQLAVVDSNQVHDAFVRALVRLNSKYLKSAWIGWIFCKKLLLQGAELHPKHEFFDRQRQMGVHRHQTGVGKVFHREVE